MRAPIVLGLAAAASGCAQIAGLDETSARHDGSIDAPLVRRDAGIDTFMCSGGDVAMGEPNTGHCYTFYMTAMGRDAARSVCQAAGAHLARIESAIESTLIQNLIGAQTLAFLGGNDEGAEGTFVWDDGSQIVLTNWNTGEPNNGAGMFEEDCIVMSGPNGGRWDDRPCSAAITTLVPGEYPFVCERP